MIRKINIKEPPRGTVIAYREGRTPKMGYIFYDEGKLRCSDDDGFDLYGVTHYMTMDYMIKMFRTGIDPLIDGILEQKIND